MSEISARNRYRPYPAYRDSGVEWLGEVPEGWEVGRLKRTVADAQNGSWGEESESDEDPICVRVADFNRESFTVIPDPGTRRHYSLAEFEKRRLSPGDLLLEKSGGGEKQPVGAVVIFEGCDPAICSNFVARIRSADGYSARFLAYLHASLYSQRLNVPAIKQNTGIQNLDQDAYLNTSVPLPPLPEQRAIAAFLDRETTKIDTLTAKKERLLELLDEKRTALISQAVTKGLDPDAPMKDSGVEWLGKVPEGWEVVGLTRSITEMSDYRGRTPNKVSSGVFLVTARNVRMGWIDYELSQEFISEDSYREVIRRGVPAVDDILFTTEAPLGNVALVDREDVAFAQRIIRFRMRPDLSVPRFAVYQMMSMSFRAQLHSAATGSTAEGIKASKLSGLRMLFPPPPEQQAIAAFLDHETTKIDTLKSKIQHAIDLLKEYHTALISAAVTGKIDVRDEVAA